MIGACIKWLDELRAPGDDRFGGISPADQGALELALRHGELLGEPVVVVSAGGAGAERALREALACGASRVVRIDGVGNDSLDVATALAGVLRGARFVWCGDMSSDRGSGSVPAFLAALLDARQALGGVAVELGEGTSLVVTRRLDGGRREVLSAAEPCVVSVEGGVARLRRAGLAASLRAGSAEVEVVVAPVAAERHLQPLVRPYRPRARALAAPHGGTLERLRQLTDSAGVAAHGERVTLDPPAAAERIVSALREWGYLS